MILRYAIKSTRATIQLVLTLVVGIVCVLLLFSTVSRWRFESNMRDAVRAVVTGDGDPISPLTDAEAAKPDEPGPPLFRGQYYLEQALKAIALADQKKEKDKDPEYGNAINLFEKARESFEKAQELRRARVAPDSSSDTAIVGAACATIGKADCSPTAQKPALLDEAAKKLDEAGDQQNGEVLIARIQLALVKGDLQAAQKGIDAVGDKIDSAGRLASGSFYWARGLAGLIARKPSAVDDMRRAFNYAPTEREHSRALSLAIRVACADASPGEAADRAKAMQKLLEQLPKVQKTKPGFERSAEAAAWNAVGLAYLKAAASAPTNDEGAPLFESARNALSHAKDGDQDIAYKVNYSMLFRIKAEHRPETGVPESPKDWKRNRFAEAATTLVQAFRALGDNKAPDAARACEVLEVGAGMFHYLGDDSQAQIVLDMAHGTYNLDEKEYQRSYGALHDWMKRLDLAKPFYEKAIELQHKDSGKMRERLAVYEKEKGKK